MQKSGLSVGENSIKLSKKSSTRRMQDREIDNRSKPLKQWMIARLQYKVMVLVLSLLESRDHNDEEGILKRIQRNLPIDFLQSRMKRVFVNYKKLYETKELIEDAFKHVLLDSHLV